MINGLYVNQEGHSYKIFTPTGEQVALIFMGYDGQFMHDVAALNVITKALAKRWHVESRAKN